MPALLRCARPARRGPAWRVNEVVRAALAPLVESGVGADTEGWLASHRSHPRAEETRKKAGERLSIWLRGSRGCLGQAYLTLIPVP